MNGRASGRKIRPFLRYWILPSLAIASMLGAQGCAAVGLTLLGVAAGTATGTGVAYSLDSVAYKTFVAPVDAVQKATLKALDGMDISVKTNERTDTGRKLVAAAEDRTVEIELERLTAKSSRMRVNVKQGLLFKDRATAAEIIGQTEAVLESEPALTRTGWKGKTQ